jgi:quinol monooxygenase YgiN
MRALFAAIAGAVLLCAAATGLLAATAPATAVYVTTFVEVLPGSANQAEAMLKDYRNATRNEPGVLQADLYQEIGTPSRFVTNEVWRDMAAYNAHAAAAARSTLWQKLQPIEYGPPDPRTHFAHFVSVKTDAPPANSIFVLSHLDVTPPQVPTLLELMKPLTENSAQEPGSEVYEILRQGQMPETGNHFRLFEVWASEKAWEDHNMAPHTQTFRNRLAPLLGTPYDQRKYIRLN